MNVIWEFVFELLLAWLSWRFYVCLGLAVAIAALVHHFLPGHPLAWPVSIAIVIAGIVAGCFWHRHEES